LLDVTGGYSFLNFASLSSYFSLDNNTNIKFFCDGGLLAIFISLITGKSITRTSFDFTSIARNVLEYSNINQKSIYFVGATEDEINTFIVNIENQFVGIPIAGYQSGYYQDEKVVIQSVINSNANIVVVGLGAGKQEDFLSLLSDSQFSGVAFSCGGFIRQLASSKNEHYYPAWINKLKLRAFYRMYREPHTIKRYLIDYPINMFKLMFFIAIGKVELDC